MLFTTALLKIKYTGFVGNNIAKFIDYQILANEVEIEWKDSSNSSYWYSINGHGVSNFCLASWSIYDFEFDLCYNTNDVVACGKTAFVDVYLRCHFHIFTSNYGGTLQHLSIEILKNCPSKIHFLSVPKWCMQTWSRKSVLTLLLWLLDSSSHHV